MNMEEIDKLAKIIWDYHHLNQSLKKSDCLLILGSHDPRVAEYAADLYFQGWAPYLIFSGNVGVLTRKIFKKPEAEVFAEAAIKRGVPRENIYLENKSTNTGQNFQFTDRLIREKGLSFNSFIVVQKPFMERRAYATAKKLWPEKEIIVTSPSIPYNEYFTDIYPKDYILNVIVGDLQRVKIYAERGFQIPQTIPPKVWKAFERLVELGYDKHLVK
jgi:uncharacterized SAM-binding protein YcdF (DUF218 family)